MFQRKFEKVLLPVAALVAILVFGMLVTSPRGLAQSAGASFDPARVEQGLNIAPVKLTYPPQYRTWWDLGVGW